MRATAFGTFKNSAPLVVKGDSTFSSPMLFAPNMTTNNLPFMSQSNILMNQSMKRQTLKLQKESTISLSQTRNIEVEI